MYKLLQNKHFVDTTARVLMYALTLSVVTVIFWKAPEQAVQIMNAGAYVLGGAVLKQKLGL